MSTKRGTDGSSLSEGSRPEEDLEWVADRGWTAAYGEWGAPPSQWGLLRHQDQLYKKWQREQPEEVARLEALTAGVVREAEMRARMRIPPEYVRLHVSCAAPLHATWRLRIARTLTGGVGDDLSGGRPPERYRLVSEQLAFALSRTHAGRVDAKLGAGPVSIGVLSLASPDERRRRAESGRQLDGLRVAEARRRAVAPPLPGQSVVQQLLAERRGLFSVHCTIEPSPWWQSAQPRISLRYARELAIGTSDGEGFRTVVPHGEADDARAFNPLLLPPPPAAAAAYAYGPYARGAPPGPQPRGQPGDAGGVAGAAAATPAAMQTPASAIGRFRRTHFAGTPHAAAAVSAAGGAAAAADDPYASPNPPCALPRQPPPPAVGTTTTTTALAAALAGDAQLGGGGGSQLFHRLTIWQLLPSSPAAAASAAARRRAATATATAAAATA